MPSISPMPDRMDRPSPATRGCRPLPGRTAGWWPLDPAQRIADLVGHARRHLAEGGQLLAVDEPPLRLHLLGQVVQHAHRAHALASVVEEAVRARWAGKTSPRPRWPVTCRSSRPHPRERPRCRPRRPARRREQVRIPEPAHLEELIAEQPAARRIHGHEPAGGVRGEDAVVHALDHRGEQAARRA